MTIDLGETHVPIPNTLVKPFVADGSAMYCGVRVGYRQALFVFSFFIYLFSQNNLFFLTFWKMVVT